MKLKINYFLIPLVVMAVAFAGSLVTTPNIDTWYSTLKLPSIAPAGPIIGLVWSVLYILIAISGVIIWNKLKHDNEFWKIVAIFALNLALNKSWSFVFFGFHAIGSAVFVSALMAFTIYLLVYYVYPKNKAAAYLLIPYGAWVTFATYLNYAIFTLNK